ncbi:hypothetical protein V8E51_003502 [Hyaloscypha variabilis]
MMNGCDSRRGIRMSCTLFFFVAFTAWPRISSEHRSEQRKNPRSRCEEALKAWKRAHGSKPSPSPWRSYQDRVLLFLHPWDPWIRGLALKLRGSSALT